MTSGNPKEIVIILLSIVQIISNSAIKPTPNKEELIKILETEKDDIFNQINEAIDDTVKSLAAQNDTDAQEGVKQMTELKKQLSQLNDLSSENSTVLVNGTRRHLHEHARNNEIYQIIYEMAAPNIIKQWNKRNVTNRERYRHKIVIQKKIDEWMKNKQLEKVAVDSYKKKKKKKFINEKCPSFGDSSKIGYPCCRKCCKQSYMGCL